MRAVAAALALAVVPAPVLAQGPPAFDEALGYEILDVFDDGLVVMNAGQGFYCEIDEGPDDRYLVMTGCLPILAPGQAADLAEAAQAEERSAEVFAEAVDGLPSLVLTSAVERTFQTFGCRLSKDDDQRAIQRELARHVAAVANYAGPLTEDVLDAIGRKGEDALERMIASGRIVIDPQDNRIARLKDCP